MEERAILSGTDLDVQKCFVTALQNTILAKTCSGQWNKDEIPEDSVIFPGGNAVSSKCSKPRDLEYDPAHEELIT